jgi:hypothetical protein
MVAFSIGLIGIAQGSVVGGGVSDGNAVSVGRGVKVKVAVSGVDVCVGASGVGMASTVAACGAQDTRMLTNKLKANKVLLL